ncbi:MAG: prolyl oligopeptidase family serine peptidase [Pseudomonadota bacterium]
MFKSIRLALAASFVAASAEAAPPLEAYGALPSMRAAEVSPSGSKVGFLQREKAIEGLVVYDLVGDDSVAITAGDIKARYVSFPTDDHAIVHASETTQVYGFKGKFEFSAAIAVNLKTGKSKQLLRGSEDLYPAQEGLGRIVGVLDGSNHVFMPAFVGSRNTGASYALMKVNLDNGRGRIHRRGGKHTIDWFVDRNGEVIAREEYNEKRNRYAVFVYENGDPREIYADEDAKLPPIAIVGVKPDRTALLVSARSSESGQTSLYELGFDGKFSQPVFSKEGADVDRIILDQNRFAVGVEYSGLFPSYEFYDDRLDAAVEAVSGVFPDAAVTIESWSDGFKHFVVSVAGGARAPAYYLLDRSAAQPGVKGSMKLMKIGDAYEGVTDTDVAEVVTIEYKARDGVSIPSILTRPVGWTSENAYPTIILPHGGPESYDAVGFDWMAQFFASRGFLVLQPNFRGSDGFGLDHMLAGRGEWGRGVMQHDITDGVNALTKAGWADPEKICIVGASYGGYAALAGGAFTPELYACVAAIAPVSDVAQMIYQERNDSGRDSWVYEYWRRLTGDPRRERDKLKSISPSEHADAFSAPVLLIHGNDDTIVPYRQSATMERALKRAGKDVTMVKLKGGDHWLSTSETRLKTLKALDAFVSSAMGADAADGPAP